MEPAAGRPPEQSEREKKVRIERLGEVDDEHVERVRARDAAVEVREARVVRAVGGAEEEGQGGAVDVLGCPPPVLVVFGYDEVGRLERVAEEGAEEPEEEPLLEEGGGFGGGPFSWLV